MKKILNRVWILIEKIIDFIFKRILHLQLNDERRKAIVQFVKFGMVGVSNTLITYVTYVLFIMMGIHYLIANFISFVISVLNSFYWNNKYVFTDKTGVRSWKMVLLKTFAAYSFAGIFLNSILLYIEIDTFSINKILAQLLNLIVTIPINFIINKFWAYKIN